MGILKNHPFYILWQEWKELEVEWALMVYNLRGLSNIVQNIVPIPFDQIKDWKKAAIIDFPVKVAELETKMKDLVKRTAKAVMDNNKEMEQINGAEGLQEENK